MTVFLHPLAALPSPPSYTHRPGRSGAHEPAGSGVDCSIPQNSFVWVWLKMGSRAGKNPRVGGGEGHRRPDARDGAAGMARPEPPTLDRSQTTHPRPLPSHLPYTCPEPPTLHLPTGLPYTCPGPPTLHLPTGLP
jgi:hypothetical protein